MEIWWRKNAAVQAAIYDVILLGEAQNLTVPVSIGDLYHLPQIILVDDVSRDMETKKSRHHN